MAAREFWQKDSDTILRQGIVAASRFYRFFEYELSIFIACRAFPTGRKMAETNSCNDCKCGVFSIESGSVK
jgi:hypothetical protein